MTNLSILAQNLEPTFSPNGFKEFLWACEKSGNDRYFYRAEAHARAWDKVHGFLEPSLLMAARNLSEALAEKAEAALPSLTLFFRDRLRAMNYPSAKGTHPS